MIFDNGPNYATGLFIEGQRIRLRLPSPRTKLSSGRVPVSGGLSDASSLEKAEQLEKRYAEENVGVSFHGVPALSPASSFSSAAASMGLTICKSKPASRDLRLSCS